MISINYFDDLEVFACGVDHAFSNSFDQSWPDLYSVQFLWRGTMQFGVDGGPVTLLTAPVLYWIVPEHRYFLSRAAGDDLRHYILFRGMRAVRIMSAGFARLDPAGYVRVARAVEVDAACRALAAALNPHTAATRAESALLLERILCLAADVDQTASGGPVAEAISEAVRQLREHPESPPDLEALARSLGLSYSHFRKCFRDQVGRSPYDYFLHCRMQAAAAMLPDRGQAIKEVAEACGYRDAAEFSRAFRRQLGLSPSTYRQLTGGR